MYKYSFAVGTKPDRLHIDTVLIAEDNTVYISLEAGSI